MYLPHRDPTDDLTRVMLNRMPKDDVAILEPPVWGKRKPPMTHQFGYTGGGFVSGLMGGKKPIDY